MALPALTNQSISTFARLDFNTPPTPTEPTSLIVPQTSTTASTTINANTCTYIFRADNAVWDDTDQVWVSIDKLAASIPTPRK